MSRTPEEREADRREQRDYEMTEVLRLLCIIADSLIRIVRVVESKEASRG